jgi:hypothetical protein
MFALMVAPWEHQWSRRENINQMPCAAVLLSTLSTRREFQPLT